MRAVLLKILRAGLAVLALGAIVFAIGVAEAQRDPQIARYRIALPGLARPLRLVQLSDSHASAIDMRPDRLARVVGMINARRPDLIVLTGDYVSGDPARWSADETRAALAPFGRLRAPLGVFAVLGNHDDRFNTAAGMTAAGVRLLVGARADAGPVQIVGADDLLGGSPAVEAMRKGIRRADRSRPVIALVHEPSFFPWLQPALRPGPVLMIAGHTHGGQVHLPVIGSWWGVPYYQVHRRGLFVERGNLLVVSSGLGTTNLPIRIGVPPEIVEIELVPYRGAGNGLPLRGAAEQVPPHSVGRNSGTDR